MEISVFGIRHHGPGSAKNLKDALALLSPDCILIEGPADAEPLLKYVANATFRLPIALLVYNPKALSQASYFPFAEFSPEWQAIQYGAKNEVPVRFMDLPMGMHFYLENEQKQNPQLFENILKKEYRKSENLSFDPLGYLAKLAGYSDSERWWEVTFERQESESGIFSSLLELMKMLREEVKTIEPENLLREAYMRKMIRKAKGDGFQNVAVVCGAWHAPVLHDIKTRKAKDDNAILRGIKKVTTKAAWIPWNYERLSTQSGYNAGVISPAWYELLYKKRKEASTHWLVKAARLLRKESLDASSANIIEAVRLAKTLASIRKLEIPGIEELKEAAISVLCDGVEEKVALIEKRLIIGKKQGKVPKEVPVIPLQKDLEKLVKSARLSKEYVAEGAVDKNLDLRKPNQLLASHLLHRLNILNIPWGQQKKGSRYALGSFSESWKLKWKPDFSIRIIEAGMWGNTVLDASSGYLQETAPTIDKIAKLTHLIQQALDAELKEAMEPLIQRLQHLSAITKDAGLLMEALPSLAFIFRYGDTRNTASDIIGKVIHQIIPRMCIALPGACSGIDEESARDMFDEIRETNSAISLLNIQEHNQLWYDTLSRMLNVQDIAFLIKGSCSRILFDKRKITGEEAADTMQFIFSSKHELHQAANWLEGFLHGSGLLLIYNQDLWTIFDNWLGALSSGNFQTVLPLLRRIFSGFSSPEREKMLLLAKNGNVFLQNEEVVEWDETRTSVVETTVKQLLGL